MIPRLDEILDLAGVDVQALARLRRADRLDRRPSPRGPRWSRAGGAAPRARGGRSSRPSSRRPRARRAASSLTLSAAFSSATPPPGTMPSSSAARVACRASSTRCFFSFISVSVAAPTLTTATPPDSFARRSWSFSRSKSESVVSISALICLIRALIASDVAGAVDDRGRVLVDDDLAGAAELRELRVLELEPHLLGDHLAAGEDRDVLEHPLAAVAEARRLDGDGLERAAQLVDDDRRERLALDVLGHDQQRLAGLDDLLEQRQQVLDAADLLVGDQDVRVVEHGLHALGVVDHVRRQVALVELHALGELELEAEGLALLDVHDAVLADLLDRVGDHVADLALTRGDRRHAGDVLLAVDLDRLLLQVLRRPPRRPSRSRA